MTHQTADRLHVTAAWLNTLPVPEPATVGVDPAGPFVTWRVEASDALAILAAIGGTWSVVTDSDKDPRTIADRFDIEHLGTRIMASVVVPGINLPDLAADAAKRLAVS